MVFQQPRLAVDPRFTLRRAITDADTRLDVQELADLVGLTAQLLDRRPREVSEGQLERAWLARALSVEPRCLLDASTIAALVRTVRTWSGTPGTG